MTKRKRKNYKTLTVSLLLILTGPFLMYHSIIGSSVFLWVGLFVTSLGMLLVVLRA